MFEDLIVKPDDEEMILYICENTDICDSIFCLHKGPHSNTELGRPDQPEKEKPCDCSQVSCEYHYNILGRKLPGAVCKPI